MDPITENPLPKIAEFIQKGSTGVIILPVNPTLDATAAATTLYLGLTKLSKNVSIACETAVKHQVTGFDKIQSSMSASGDNLVISFPYTDGSIDKVDYNIQGSFFNLVITPRPGNPKIDPNQVRYTYAGGTFDFIITIDAPSLQSLGKLFTEKQSDFQGRTIINIDRHLINSYYGLANLVNKTSSSTSELVLIVLRELQVEIDREMATNLYSGVTAATNNFTSYSTNADTFEAAAQLLKAGALKKPPVRAVNPAVGMNRPVQNSSPFSTATPFMTQPSPAPRMQQSMSANEKLIRPMDVMETEPNEEESDDAGQAPQQTPQQWLKPKIFRGNGLI